MNRLPVFDSDICKVSDSIHISDPWRLNHLVSVLRVSVGDSIRVTMVDQGLAQAEVLEHLPDKVILRVTDLSPALARRGHLLIGLCRPPSIEKILEHTCTAGIASINFFGGELSEKSYWNSKVLRDENVRARLLEGLAQSNAYATLPEIRTYKSLRQVPFSSLPECRILLNRDSKNSLAHIGIKDRDYCAAIGPERGLTFMESERLLAENFLPLSLTDTTLRVEFACYYLMAQADLLQKLELTQGS